MAAVVAAALVADAAYNRGLLLLAELISKKLQLAELLPV
jgi:hypothetical protein